MNRWLQMLVLVMAITAAAGLGFSIFLVIRSRAGSE